MNEMPKDPFILLSMVNMKLRDYYPTLDELCEDMNLEKEDIIEKLAAAGFEYIPECNQFR